MRDEKGLDEKILAVPLADPRFDGIQDLAEIHGHWLAEIRNFFATYKMLEGKETHVEGWKGAREAREVLRRCGPPHGTTEAGEGASRGSIPAPRDRETG